MELLANIFTGLLLVAVLFLVLGLIKPKMAFMKNRKRVLGIYLSLIIIAFIGIAVSLPEDYSGDSDTATEEEADTKADAEADSKETNGQETETTVDDKDFTEESTGSNGIESESTGKTEKVDAHDEDAMNVEGMSPYEKLLTYIEMSDGFINDELKPFNAKIQDLNVILVDPKVALEKAPELTMAAIEINGKLVKAESQSIVSEMVYLTELFESVLVEDPQMDQFEIGVLTSQMRLFTGEMTSAIQSIDDGIDKFQAGFNAWQKAEKLDEKGEDADANEKYIEADQYMDEGVVLFSEYMSASIKLNELLGSSNYDIVTALDSYGLMPLESIFDKMYPTIQNFEYHYNNERLYSAKIIVETGLDLSEVTYGGPYYRSEEILYYCEDLELVESVIKFGVPEDHFYINEDIVRTLRDFGEEERIVMIYEEEMADPDILLDNGKPMLGVIDNIELVKLMIDQGAELLYDLGSSGDSIRYRQEWNDNDEIVALIEAGMMKQISEARASSNASFYVGSSPYMDEFTDFIIKVIDQDPYEVMKHVDESVIDYWYDSFEWSIEGNQRDDFIYYLSNYLANGITFESETKAVGPNIGLNYELAEGECLLVPNYLYISAIYENINDNPQIIDQIKDYEVVKLLSNENGIYEIEREDGQVGYVYGENVFMKEMFKLQFEYIEGQWRLNQFLLAE